MGQSVASSLGIVQGKCRWSCETLGCLAPRTPPGVAPGPHSPGGDDAYLSERNIIAARERWHKLHGRQSVSTASGSRGSMRRSDSSPATLRKYTDQSMGFPEWLESPRASPRRSPRSPCKLRRSPRTPHEPRRSPRTPADSKRSPRTPADSKRTPRTPASQKLLSPRTPYACEQKEAQALQPPKKRTELPIPSRDPTTTSTPNSLPNANSLAALGAALAKTTSSHEGSPAADALEEDRDGEPWLEYLERCTETVAELGLSNEPRALFEAFRSSDDPSVIFATFARLYHLATAGRMASIPETRRSQISTKSIFEEPGAPWEGEREVEGRHWQYPYEPIRVIVGGNFKAKQLWELLDKRCGRPEYAARPCGPGREFDGRRVVIAGGGPCGLRAAIEMRLLGARVTVVERRTRFSRINQLHLWKWCGEDLKQLGARVLEPPPKDFGCNPDILHAGIADLQLLLLKVALLLGAEVLLGSDVAETKWCPSTHTWETVLAPPFSTDDAAASASNNNSFTNGNGITPSPSPRPPCLLQDIGAFVVASGFGSSMVKEYGFETIEAGSAKSGSAIGVVANFARSKGTAERLLRSHNMAKQFAAPLFRQLSATAGADLENIVYTKGSTAHYMVMTPTAKCLLQAGVLKEDSSSPLVCKANVDNDQLDAFVRKVADFKFKREDPAILSALSEDLKPGASQTRSQGPAYADAGPRIFDFSKARRATCAMRFLAPPGNGKPAEEAEHLPVVIVGDPLIEPFWPEGLGIMRGFFGVLDACSSLSKWCLGASMAETQVHAEAAFTQLKTLSAATRAMVLAPKEDAFAVEPSTRYRRFSTKAWPAPARLPPTTGCAIKGITIKAATTSFIASYPTMDPTQSRCTDPDSLL
eukprot:TRINITY_DN4701_c0_g1_i1.p1 TRINITY_DN4701_c0_g1~~TRINITY_DN4701_c0_g1_i1.p1  ORF type:complete len:874 (-),score=182.43 TRINITY_DN4701_c0_g1_i1:216-2837(-)